MCFHISVWEEPEYWERKFKVKISDERIRPVMRKPQYHLNGFSHPNMLVIPQQYPEVLAPGVWGIVPEDKSPDEIKSYYKEAIPYGGGLNARAEKLFNHFIYKRVIRNQRCIIPINGYFDPHEYQNKKFPFYIQNIKNEPLALAGIYTLIGTYITFAIITKQASPLLAKVHNVKKRQPLILDTENINNWLDSTISDSEILETINFEYPESMIKIHSVSKDLFSPKVNSNVKTIVNEVKYEGVSVI
ncbi:SOS response-associated peptidase [Formosa sp. S-31]|uniref:SOS response-associated peptidase n=1 Tax=Formosa sp. S-31 TaxID=2790949 RepID=UPI003EBE1312